MAGEKTTLTFSKLLQVLFFQNVCNISGAGKIDLAGPLLNGAMEQYSSS
jgi:hypothetical protein